MHGFGKFRFKNGTEEKVEFYNDKYVKTIYFE